MAASEEHAYPCFFCEVLVTTTWNDHVPQCPQLHMIRQAKYKVMEQSLARVISFKTWPKETSFIHFVNNGFYYSGKSDIVSCFFCLLSLGNWHLDDNSLKRHVNCSPGCKFMLDRYQFKLCYYCRNIVTISHDERQCSERVCTTLGDTWQLQDHQARLETFRTWTGLPAADTFAYSGLYYTGALQHVTCFSCNVWISDWQENDDPIDRHLASFPTCELALWAHQLKKKLSKVNYAYLKQESHRLDTFEAFSLGQQVDVTIMAKLGFFNVNYKKLVQCVFCKVILGPWTRSWNPLRKHLQSRPTCPFLRGKAVGNVASAEIVEAVHPEMNSNMKRVCTFSNYPEKKAFKLANHGIFLNNEKDLVCFWCGFHTRDSSCILDLHRTDNSTNNCLLNNPPESSQVNNICKVCYTNELEIMFEPCNHLVCCVLCASSIKKCMICREVIIKKVRLYMS